MYNEIIILIREVRIHLLYRELPSRKLAAVVYDSRKVTGRLSVYLYPRRCCGWT